MMYTIKNIKVMFLNWAPGLLIISSFFLFTGCKRTSEELESIGPDYAPAPAGFYVDPALPFRRVYKGVTPGYSLTYVDFTQSSTNEKSHLRSTATFSHPVTWTITITGQQSGAVKTFTGTSNFIDTITWNGESSSLNFFRKLEKADVVLSILGWPTTYSYTVDINKVYDYNNKTVNGIRHVVLDDFDPTFTSGLQLSSPFHDQGDGNVISESSDKYSVSGAFSYHFKGKDVDNNTWLAGINTDPLDTIAHITFPKVVTVTDPEELWVNIYVYGTGKANSAIQLKLYEEEIPSEPYDQTHNDGYVYDIFPTWAGWQLVSAKYSDFHRSSDPNLGGNGNGIKEPYKICGAAIGLNSQPTGGAEVEVYMDYFILTEHGRFNPY